MTRRINAAGLSLIKSFEGFEPRWYRDPVGIWTIGYGHTDAAGMPKHAASEGLTLSETAATALLADDLGQYEAAVEKTVKVPLNDNQFAALVSFTYNLGAGALAKSTLVRKLNAGEYAAVPSELAKWDKAKGKTLKGLTRRRAAEAALFVKAGSTAPAPPKGPDTDAIRDWGKTVEDAVNSAPAPAQPAKGGFWASVAALLKKLIRGGQ